MAEGQRIAMQLHRALGDAAEGKSSRGEDAALRLAERLGIRGYLEHRLPGRVAPEDTPATEAARARERALLEAAREITNTLSENDIQHFWFKGVPMLGRFYGPGERGLDDIDVMIDPLKRNTAFAALHAIGYVEYNEPADAGPAALRPGQTMHRTGTDAGPVPVLLDMHWGLESATGLLSQTDVAIPLSVWRGIRREHGLPVPLDEHHIGLLIHHLVRHDMLHFRGLLDVALLWDTLPKVAGSELDHIAERFGVRRAARAVARVLVSEVNLYPLRGIRIGVEGLRGRWLQHMLRLRRWIGWANQAERHEHVLITPGRVWRRFLLADDMNSAVRALRDVVRPPPEYLRWRWPKAQSNSDAWWQHVRHFVGQVAGRSPAPARRSPTASKPSR